jgi:hypothetical protein
MAEQVGGERDHAGGKAVLDLAPLDGVPEDGGHHSGSDLEDVRLDARQAVDGEAVGKQAGHHLGPELAQYSGSPAQQDEHVAAQAAACT